MARFNVRVPVRPDTVNREGSPAYTASPELALASLLLTNFCNDQFYRSADETQKELVHLVRRVDPRFAAQAALYARNVFGMRTVSHIVAAELAPISRGTKWIRGFYERIVHRVDDMGEILAYYQTQYGKHPVPNAMKRGFARAFNKFDGYQLAKYQGNRSAVKLIDLVNVVRPKPTAENAQALKDLVAGKLRQTDTWEDQLSAAGKDTEAKATVWRTLIRERKIGYFALLRNLRNILEQAPDMTEAACAMLTDATLISKSLVLPFRYMTALDALQTVDTPKVRPVLEALSQAVDISCANVPKLPGSTYVALDGSGSMRGKPIEIGSLFASILYKTQEDCDLALFDTSIRFLRPTPSTPTLEMARMLQIGFGGGTDFRLIFDHAKRSYDRIIILSDMQAWVGYATPEANLRDYRKRTGANPNVFSWDLQGYGTLQFPESKLYCLAGWSDKAFDILAVLEQGRDALVNRIRRVELP